MLKTLQLNGFTVFADSELTFAPGLNVIVGENGTGKTQLLKIGYLASTIHEKLTKQRPHAADETIEQHIGERLLNLYRIDSVGSLQRRHYSEPTSVAATIMGDIPTATIRVAGEEQPPARKEPLHWSFSYQQDGFKLNESTLRPIANAAYPDAVFIPSKEMLSFFEGFSALYLKREVAFDETFFDLANKLEISRLKNPEPGVQQLIQLLTAEIGGELQLEGGRFYTLIEQTHKQEVTLLAEGLRKLATLIRLLENGSLQVGGILFWDEPESNLNPRLIKLMARVLCLLSQQGVQVVLATHSLFLLRELEIQLRKGDFTTIQTRFFALKPSAKGVEIEQGDRVEDLDTLVLLDEELEQSDRFMEVMQ